MEHRIRAAWKVLRGEWVAHAPAKPITPYVYTSNGVSVTNATVTWGLEQPTREERAEIARRAGRRAVHKYGEALQRLAS